VTADMQATVPGLVLDAVFLAEPGVLEARQRITLRMHAARPA
jgi:hypothetical protein